MSELIVFVKGQDKSRMYEDFVPSIRFQIPSELRLNHYIDFVTQLFQDFIRDLSDQSVNQFVAERFYFGNVGEEGGVAGIYMGEKYFSYCKLYAYDGEHDNNVSDWKGVWMRNHMDQSSRVQDLYELAERFEIFLQGKGIDYQRFGQPKNTRGWGDECEQVTKAE